MANEYHFSVGNSTEGHIGLCAVVIADTPEQAVERLKESMAEDLDAAWDHSEHVQYSTVYLNPEAFTVDDIDDVIPHEPESSPSA